VTTLHPLMAGKLAASYFDRFADVSDGDYGVPEPNEEMRLLDICKRAIAELEAEG
jgi:hypothetical protein